MGAMAAAVDEVPVADRRHPVRLRGACSINGGPDVLCTAVDISSTRLRVETSAPVKFLDPVLLSLPQLGILEAPVADVFDNGFALTFEPAPLSKLGIFVAWLGGADSIVGGNCDKRGFERLVPIKRLTSLRRGGEAPSMVRIIDLSRSGVAFTTSRALAEGDDVQVGTLAGRVARLFPGGAAVQFDDLIAETIFDAMIDLDEAGSTGAAH